MTGRAFTLVEILVVLAIVGILIALTVGIVTRVRVAAGRVDCAAHLRVIGQAFTSLHHRPKSELPVSVNIRVNSVAQLWNELQDPQQQHHLWFTAMSESGRIPAPMELAVLRDLKRVSADTDDNDASINGVAGTLDRSPLVCPRDENPRHSTPVRIETTTSAVEYLLLVSSSYAWNGTLFAFDGQRPFTWPRQGGRVARQGTSAERFLAADCLPSGRTGWLPPLDAAPGTNLAQQVDLADPTDPQLDSSRHRGQVNVLFTDGHVEQVEPTRQELSRIKL